MKFYILFGIAFILTMPMANGQIDPNWEADVTGYEQPSWFNSQRVQIHSRVARPYYNNPNHALYSSWAEKVITVVGANTFVRHIKTDDAPIQWKSAWGEWTTTAENDRNIIQEAVDEAHTHNTKMIGYYNHYTDGYLRDNFPQYKCKDKSGNDVVRNGRGTMICFNSPAADLIQTRLIEFIKMGGDGIYFDELHMPSEGCWCNNCQTKYQTLTGNAIPTVNDVYWQNQKYKNYQNFNNASVLETFYNWRTAIMEENPEAVMIIGSNTFPRMMNRHLNSDLLRVSHAHKTEWDLANKALANVPYGIYKPRATVWRGLAYNLSRDVGDGRPAHYWIPGMSYVPSNVLKAATAGMISFGNIANIDMREILSPDMDFVDAVTYGNTVSPTFEGTKPARWLLIHFNEKALETHLGTTSAGWTNFLSAFYGAYHSAHEQRIPMGIITDSQIRQGLFQDAKVLFLPNASILSAGLQAKITAFENAGGIVITQNSSWQWHNSSGFNSAKTAFKALLDNVAERPFMKSQGSSFYYANYFTKKENDETTFLASYSNNLEWIITHVGSDPTDYSSGGYPNSAPAPVSGITLTVNSGATPKSVKNVVTGASVSYNISGDKLTLTVPTFQEAALIEIKYDDIALSQTSASLNKEAFLHPNPVSDVLYVNNLKEGSNIEIHNILGQLVTTKKNSATINVSGLYPGLYVLTITNGNKKETLKFVKK
ncbi:MAG: T9SS type A sorting domain-containing protein [Aestuariibaculum sp.]